MTQERFLTADVLPVEVIDRIQRKLRSLYVTVQDDPQQTGVMTVRFVVRANAIGDVDGEYSIHSKLADSTTQEIGKIRDGQLVLPGTEQRSDDPPPRDWQNDMLALPGRR